MSNYLNSPVPINQIPHQEFIQLKNSYFFSWPYKTAFSFNKNILISWLISYPFFLIISSGSYYLKQNTIKLVFISLAASAIIPFVILLRQYLGWSYVCERLSSHSISYEESDWHDGQTWAKPNLWIIRDKLIINNEIYPIFYRIRITTFILLIIFLIIFIYGFFYPN